MSHLSLAGRGVLELRKYWDAEAKENRSTVRKEFAAAGELQILLATLAENPDNAPAAHRLIRKVLGYPEKLTEFHGERSGAELIIPDAQIPGVDTVLILQACPVDFIEDLLAPETGRLLAPAVEENKPLDAVSKVASAIFRCDRPPPFVLVQAGRWMLLAEAERWAEGRYLAVDLLVVSERRHEARGGEIDRTVAIVGSQAVTANANGSIWWTAALADSVKHTVGVSKDLREGIRLSIEIIANDVLRRRAERNLSLGEINGQDLAQQSLRFLYRILFLLYAEASPEMRVLPSGAPEYENGYGLDRLRELTLTELVSQQAQSGTHLYLSLAKLFELVDRGHTPGETEQADDPAPGLQFNSLRADLFSPKATALIDQVGLTNDAVQQVLEHLLLSKESKGRKGADRGFISYAELGINQLGAVYEGLMSYTGFFAETDLYEVAKGGNSENGSWVVPTDRADHLSPNDFVRVEDPITGEPRPVVHHQGTFVFRLAGRERQQSASYYTPEVLTKFVVSQSLAELLDQDGVRTTPEQILEMTICEPALGSGAFAIEAVRQLAAEYLKRKQEDLDELIDADQYAFELQKVKAHIALHQVYGVDLNGTAVELAEISLWLDTMVAGLQAPWFGLHLRRGNSLIGARRAVYSPGQLTKKAWLTTPATDIPLDTDISTGGVHHFLLPSQGWGAVVDTAEAKTYASDKREELRQWRAGIRGNPSPAIKKRLANLAQRVETLWEVTLRRLTIAESEIRRSLNLWGSEPTEYVPVVTREQIEKVLHDESGSYRRLRRVMDAWCALWSWPLTTHIPPPGWDEWVGGLEAILGVPPKVNRNERLGQLSAFANLGWFELDDAESNELLLSGAQSIERAEVSFPWLAVAESIATAQGFFHWELDFASVFERGGFDLQVGNPPWVRPDWDEAGALAEFDPWWQLTDKAAETKKRQKRPETLKAVGALAGFLSERSAQAGLKSHYGSGLDRPVLTGLQPDLYRCFMERTWRSMSPKGVVGLIHPESHFSEMRAAGLRRESYTRLRRHWQFQNQLKLFDIGNTREYGIHIYGAASSIGFLQASSLVHPSTVERSLLHDGSGPSPGVKDEHDHWDLRPHAERIVAVNENQLRTWSALIDEPGTPVQQARIMYPVNRSSGVVLDRLSSASRLGEIPLEWTRGWEEDRDRRLGFFVARSQIPSSWDNVILQGPHFTISTPLFKQPNPTMRSHRDYAMLELESMASNFVPRTSYQPAKPPAEFLAAYPKWNGRSSSTFFRLIWRSMADSATVRTLHSAIIPPGPTHVHIAASAGFRDPADLVVCAGIWSALSSDFFIKAAGVSELNQGVIRRLPHVRHHPLESELILRTLRLNCLVQPYSPLWEELFSSGWQSLSWVPGIGVDYVGRPLLGAIEPDWHWSTPLRRAADRRQALLEIDAIVAIMLGITAEELTTIYRTQFPVLQRYEREALYDRIGRQLPTKLASEYRKKGLLKDSGLTVDGVTYRKPFVGVDRERDMELAHKHFSALVEQR